MPHVRKFVQCVKSAPLLVAPLLVLCQACGAWAFGTGGLPAFRARPATLGASGVRMADSGRPRCVSRRDALRASGPAAAAAVWGSGGLAGGAAHAADAKEVLRREYDGFSAGYDSLDGGAAAGALGIQSAREGMIGSAKGVVLEVAVGTGLNLPMYQFRGPEDGARGEVDKLIAIDLSPGMLSQARAKSAALALDASQIEFRTMDVEKLDFPDDSFDTVVDTFSLCVFTNPVAALREMKRVCKPDGRILLLENSISENGLLAAYQKATAPLVAKVGGKGCLYDQDPRALAEAAGLTVVVNKPFAGGVLRRIEAQVAADGDYHVVPPG